MAVFHNDGQVLCNQPDCIETMPGADGVSHDGAHPVNGMGEGVHARGCGEYLRKANGQMWIEYGYVRIDDVLSDIEFPADFLILDDRDIGHLAPGAGGGGDCNVRYQRVHELVDGDVVDGLSRRW